MKKYTLIKYRGIAFCTSMAFLLFAILSKIYRGPMWKFSNYHLGDIGIVASLYFGLAVIAPKARPSIKFIIILSIALAIELYQLTGIPASWNLTGPAVHILGTRFDALDFLMYIIGLTVAFVIDNKYLQWK